MTAPDEKRVWRPLLRNGPLSGVCREIGLIDGKIYAHPVYKGSIMRRILALMVATLALMQAWSVIGQMQDSLTLDSELDAPNAIKDFLNDSVNDTVNETLVDTNLSTTSSQNAFLDLPVNDSLIDTNLSTTASQGAFLDLPVNNSLIDTGYPATATQTAFLLDQPIQTPTSSYKKGEPMDSGSEDSSSQPPSTYKKGQMMG